MKRILLLCLGLMLAGCVNIFTKPAAAPEVITAQENAVPGTVRGAWEEPMYDQVEIPAQLDPNGVTYRPRHTSIVEIRSGRVQEVQFPDDRQPTSSEGGAAQ